MTTTITLETMKFRAYHGVLENERIIGNDYLVDLSYTIDTNAVETDRLEDTLSYADLYILVKNEMMRPSQLIEHVAGRILLAVKRQYPQIQKTTVRVSKLNPPVSGEVGRATVTVAD
jgi:dihydroneopterin aldolase